MKRLSWAALLSILMITAVVVAGCSSSSSPGAAAGEAGSAETIEWKIQSSYPRGDLSMETLEGFAAEVARLSNGKMKITIFADPDIVPGYQVLEATQRGTLDMFQAGGTYWGGIIPVADIEFGLPMANSVPGAASFAEEANAVRDFYYSSGLVDIIREEYAKQGIYWLDMSTNGPVITLSKKPVVTIGDLKGKKIRTQGIWSAWYAKQGAVGTEGGGGETYMELKLGTVDAAQWDISAITGLHWNEVAPYLWQPNDLGHVVGQICINLDKWNSLSADMQQVLKDAAKTYWDLTVQNYGAAMEEAEQIMGQGGYELSQFDEELQAFHMRTAVEIWDEYAKRDDASARAVQLIKDWKAGMD